MWGKNATRVYECPVPCTVEAETAALQSHLEAIQDQAEARFPNLILGFHSSRVYGGWCDPANPEPFAFNTIFAVEGAVADETKWFVGPYIAGREATKQSAKRGGQCTRLLRCARNDRTCNESELH
jgi:hypothetical protein